MATDQTSTAVKAAQTIVTGINQLLAALDNLETNQEQLAGAGVNLEDYTAALEAAADTKHCDANTYKYISFDIVPALVAFLKGYYSGTPTQQAWAAMQKARR